MQIFESHKIMKHRSIWPALLICFAMTSPPGYGQAKSSADLAKATQNPLATMISLPFQNNTNFNFGPQDKTQNILNIQPVWPFALNDKWNLITRTIVPVVSQPATAPGTDREFGIGDTTFTAFFSPRASGK